MNLKEIYLHRYQPIVYAIAVCRAEYDKVGSFITPTAVILTPLKLFFPNIPWWVLPMSLFGATISAYWFGKYLIKMGVPKKAAELSNEQNPQLIEIIQLLKK
jgi:hypothetical protein